MLALPKYLKLKESFMKIVRFICTALILASPPTALATEDEDECGKLLKNTRVVNFTEKRLNRDLNRKIEDFSAKLIDSDKKIIEQGGFTPELLLEMPAGTRLNFGGQTLVVGTPWSLVSGYVAAPLLSVQPALSLPVGVEVELVIAGYPGENPHAAIAQLPTQVPKENLQQIEEHKENLYKVINLRRYYYTATDGAFSIVEKIPDFNGAAMTLERFFRDKDLTTSERKMLAGALEYMLLKYRNVQMPGLSLPRALAFDSRDKQWKFLIASTSMRRWHGDTFASAIQLNLGFDLEEGRVGDREFFRDFYSRLTDIQERLMALRVKEEWDKSEKNPTPDQNPFNPG
jgi:hypothetical protein